MKQKFECKNCKARFEADDAERVICPQCHSDNVEFASFHISSKWLKLIAAIVVALLIVFIVLYSIRRCNTQTNPDNEVLSQDTFVYDYHEPIPPTVSVSQPMCDMEGMYSVDVVPKNVSNGMKFYYVMLSHFDKKVLQKNEDGHFSNIPYCSEDGHSYDFAIMDSKVDTLLCVPVQQTGFVKQVVIESSKKMTSEQLQKLIDTQSETLNGVGENDYLAPDYKLEFSGLKSGANKPESWAEVFEMIEFEIWKSVRVSKLSYDEKNRINVVTLKVIMP